MNKTSIEWARNPDGTQGFTWNPMIRPEARLVDDIIKECYEAGAAVFLKNSLSYLVEDEHYRFELLQDFPKEALRV